MGLECPWAEHHVTVSSTGNVSTCCMSVPVIDTRSGQPYNIKTHTITEAYNSAEFNSIRQNLRNGIKDKNCDSCWRQEDAGERSLRLRIIDEYQEVYNSGKTQGLLTAQLDLSNQCNLKCRTCNPGDSSSWIKEFYDLNERHKGFNLIEFQKTYNTTLHKEREFFDDLKNNVIPSLVVIQFQGGEPFLIKRQWEIVDSIIESGHADKMLISYHTNGTIWNEEIENKLSKFGEVDLSVSIDDIKDRFEYLRHPAKWSEVEHNIERMLNWCLKNIDYRQLSINCVVTPYNLYTIHELLDYFNFKNIIVRLHPTTLPEHFSISNIPENIKHIFLEKLKSKSYPQYQEEIDNVVSALTNKGSETQWSKFLEKTKIHDDYRNESFQKTFPETYKVLINDK